MLSQKYKVTFPRCIAVSQFGHLHPLDFLGLGGLLHVLEALWRAQLEPAAVVHVPHGLQQHAHLGDPSIDGEGHCAGVVERIIS